MNLVLFFTLVGLTVAENGLDGWLRYTPIAKCRTDRYISQSLPKSIIILNVTYRGPL